MLQSCSEYDSEYSAYKRGLQDMYFIYPKHLYTTNPNH